MTDTKDKDQEKDEKAPAKPAADTTKKAAAPTRGTRKGDDEDETDETEEYVDPATLEYVHPEVDEDAPHVTLPATEVPGAQGAPPY